MRYSLSALLIAVAFAPLAGCGQMGPLYLPTEEPAVSPPKAEQAATPVDDPQPTAEDS